MPSVWANNTLKLTVGGSRERLLGYYLDTAAGHIRAVPGSAVPDAFAERDEALAWLDASAPMIRPGFRRNWRSATCRWT